MGKSKGVYWGLCIALTGVILTNCSKTVVKEWTIWLC
jgi:hypothetical protein